MVEDLLKAGHLKQYVRTVPKGEGSSHGRGPRAPTTPVRAVINYIHGGPLDDEYSSKRKKVETAASSHGSGTHKLHPAGISQWGHPPHRRNHCFPYCGSRLSITATSRCSHPSIRSWRLRREKNPGRSRELRGSVASGGHQTNGFHTLQPGESQKNPVRIQRFFHNLA